MVMPCWCDSHTHLLYPKSREQEYVMRLAGRTYAEIHAKGGGILRSAEDLEKMSEEALFLKSYGRLEELMRMGTGAVEVKTGYGLLPEGERKQLRVARRLQKKSPIPLRITYLAAHALPKPYLGHPQRYITEVVEKEMFPYVLEQGYVDYVDVFCERGFFARSFCERVLKKARSMDLGRKVHAEQLSHSGGALLGVEMGARSVDHLEHVDANDMDALGKSDTVATLLPAAAFFLNIAQSPARALVQSGAAIALASDYNPGSSPSANMHFVVALACLKMGLLPEQALWAATFNGAVAMDCQDKVGSIAKGKWANLILTHPISSLSYIPYAFAHNLLKRVMIGGTFLY